MLWYLKQDPTKELPNNALANKETVYYILNNTEHTIGRGECNLTLPNDQSVSRKHASVWLENGIVKLKDLSSRYGTFVNPEIDATPKPITANETQTLEKGQKVRFGMQWNVWELHCVSIRTISSSMSPDQKKTLATVLTTLFGKVETDCDPACTHITTDAVYLTVKLLWGLVKGLPLVTQKYWKDCVQSVRTNRQFPDPKKYSPPVGEEVVNKENLSLDSTSRQTLFKNKIFLFSNEQSRRKLQKLVEAAGGETGLWNSVECSAMLQSNIIVLAPNAITNNDNSQVLSNIEEIETLFKENGKRLIPEHEIALAIWDCNCSRHCNPDFKLENIFGQPTFVEQFDEILVQETQNGNTQEQSGTQLIIPSSQTDMEVSSTTDVNVRKRIVEDVDDISFEIPSDKRRKMNDTTASTGASTSNGTTLIDSKQSFKSLDDIHFCLPSSKRKASEVEDISDSEAKRHMPEPPCPPPIFRPDSKLSITKLDPEIIENIYNNAGWISKSFIKLEIKDEQPSVLENGDNGDITELNNGDATTVVENGEDVKEDKKLDVKKLELAFKPFKVKVMPSIIVRTVANVSVDTNGDVTMNGLNFKKFKKASVRKANYIIQSFTRQVCNSNISSNGPVKMSDEEDSSAITASFDTNSQLSVTAAGS